MLSVNRIQAGKAELTLKIIGPRGNTLPFTMNPTSVGEHVVYTPRERGTHLIYIAYGGLDVPGQKNKVITTMVIRPLDGLGVRGGRG